MYKIFGSTKLGATVDGRPSSMTASLGEVSSHIVAESAQKLQSFQTQQQAPWLLFGLCICLSAAAGYIAPHLVNSSPPVLAEALVKPSSVMPTTSPTTASLKPTDNEISHGKKVHTEYTITGKLLATQFLAWEVLASLLSANNVDGLYLVAFCCLLPYTTQYQEVEVFVLSQMYLKQPGSIPESFGVNRKYV